MPVIGARPPNSSINFTNPDHAPNIRFDKLNNALIALESMNSPTFNDHHRAFELHFEANEAFQNTPAPWRDKFKELAIKLLLRSTPLNPKNWAEFQLSYEIYEEVKKLNATSSLIEKEHLQGYFDAFMHNFAFQLVYTDSVTREAAVDAYKIYNDIENKDLNFFASLEALHSAYAELYKANTQNNFPEQIKLLREKFNDLHKKHGFCFPEIVHSNLNILEKASIAAVDKLESFLKQHDA